MKIHHITTVNLNSLYGEHEIDLDATLEGASLFLIYGPTGSGKSTLMDAVSLALFGMTPRLNAQRGIAETDPSAIMSRGTGQCSASIVFSKIEDGGRQRYRATWSCWRAWKRPDGTPRPAVRAIERRNPGGGWELVVSSSKHKDYTPVFAEVLEGFGVRDFNRSMLLAQGEFDAFLGAPADHRAEILERLTDTSIYQKLGQRAARIRNRHESRLETLRTLFAASGGLDAEKLAQLEAEHERNTHEHEQRRQSHGRATSHLKWFDGDVEFKAKLAGANHKWDKLSEDLHAAADTLTRLSEHERCEDKRGFRQLDSYGEAQRRVTASEEQLTALDKATPGLEEATEVKQREAKAASASERLAAAHLELLRPLAGAADRANTGHATAIALVQGTTKDCKAADKQVHAGQKALDKAAASVTKATRATEEARGDLEAHAGDERLADSWGPIRTRLDQLVATTARSADDTMTLEKRGTDLKSEGVELDKDRATHLNARRTTLEPKQEAAQRAKRALEELQSQPDFEAARQGAADAVEHARDKRDAVRGAEAPVGSARDGAEELKAVQAEIGTILGQLTASRKAMEERERRVQHCAELESQAEAALEHTRRLAALLEHRHTLVEGEPCLLCGSHEHPWSGDPERAKADAAISETVAAQERAYADTVTARNEATRAFHETEVEVNQLVGRLKQQKGQEPTATEQLGRYEQTAKAALEAAGLLSDSTVGEVAEALSHAQRKLEATEKVLSTLEAARGNSVTAERQLQEALEAQQKIEDTLRVREVTLDERTKQLEKDRVVMNDSRVTLREEATACRTLLEEHGLVPEGDDPTVWRTRGDQHRDKHNARVKAVTDLGAELEKRKTTQQAKEDILSERRTRRDDLAERLSLEETKRDETRGYSEHARAALNQAWQAALAADDMRPTDGLPDAGSPPASLEEAQSTWAKRSRATASLAAEKHHKALDQLKENRVTRLAVAKTHVERGAARDQLRQELDTTLESLAVPDDRALRALRLDDELLRELRRTRDQLKHRRLEVETCIRERSEMVERHAATRPESLPDDPHHEALVTTIAEVKTLLDVAAQTHQETGDRLRDHERKVQERAESKRQLEEAERDAQVWQTLHRYIGVNDGGRFKQFAQALNLGQLLEKANVHLARLSKRYRLVARLAGGLPTLDFDLSDLWQVGERVAPRSLSGGERFLVSLSLALGLSDFRAVKMPIETLLLDEGFGTLDHDTLNVALGALSQLQADGRQVGIISHVVGLQERIEARIEVRALGGGRSEVRTRA